MKQVKTALLSYKKEWSRKDIKRLKIKKIQHPNIQAFMELVKSKQHQKTVEIEQRKFQACNTYIEK